MSKIKNLVLGTVIAASMAACTPATDKEKLAKETTKDMIEKCRNETKEDMITTIINGEKESEALHMKKFNEALRNHDMESAVYNLAIVYRNRSVYMTRDEDGSIMGLRENDYNLLPEIKEFSLVFGKNQDTKELAEMVNHAEFGTPSPNTIGYGMWQILQKVTELQKEAAKK